MTRETRHFDRRRDATRFGLTPREWRIVARVAAIIAFAIALVVVRIAEIAPAAEFIYGRF